MLVGCFTGPRTLLSPPEMYSGVDSCTFVIARIDASRNQGNCWNATNTSWLVNDRPDGRAFEELERYSITTVFVRQIHIR